MGHLTIFAAWFRILMTHTQMLSNEAAPWGVSERFILFLQLWDLQPASPSLTLVLFLVIPKKCHIFFSPTSGEFPNAIGKGVVFLPLKPGFNSITTSFISSDSLSMKMGQFHQGDKKDKWSEVT